MTLMAIAHKLGISLDYLFYGKGREDAVYHFKEHVLTDLVQEQTRQREALEQEIEASKPKNYPV